MCDRPNVGQMSGFTGHRTSMTSLLCGGKQYMVIKPLICPLCGTRVVPQSDGTCPACRRTSGEEDYREPSVTRSDDGTDRDGISFRRKVAIVFFAVAVAMFAYAFIGSMSGFSWDPSAYSSGYLRGLHDSPEAQLVSSLRAGCNLWTLVACLIGVYLLVTGRPERPDGYRKLVRLFFVIPVVIAGVAGVALVGSIPKITKVKSKAQREVRLHDLQTIGIALCNYEDKHGHFPPAAFRDGQGKPLLSWRVHLLPFLEQDTLYEEFHLDEPWDSPHNIKLLDRVPPVFSLGGNRSDGKTAVMVFVGDGTPFGSADGLRSLDIADGTSNTIMLVVAGQDKAVPWTKPEDLRFETEDPASVLGDVGEAFAAAFCDGSVRSLRKDADAGMLQKAIMHCDGRVVDMKQLEAKP